VSAANVAIARTPWGTAAEAPSGPPRILLACMPKSGSTFLTDVIAALSDVSRVELIPSPGRREQELDEVKIMKAGSGGFVAQHHVRYSEWTARMCAKHRIRPVVLVRSLPDVIVSLRDHLRREDTETAMFYAEPAHAELCDSSLERMIARLAAPWYVNFYMSWRAAPDALMISYEELIANPDRVLREILGFAGADYDDREIDEALTKVAGDRRSRLNVGVAGRGAKLEPEVLRELAALFDFYPEAADDPYVKGVRAQVAAALQGVRPPPLGSVAIHVLDAPRSPAASGPSRKKRLRWIRRHGYQITLISLGLLYWLLPYDLIPDDRRYGYIDDAVFLTVLAFTAGRITKRTPALRDLPKILSLSLGRRFKLNA
jgi:hypothetical protein